MVPARPVLRHDEAIHGLPGLTRGSREYLRDIGDHLAQVTGEFHRQTDDLGALTSTYFNANTNRLNLTVTRLTVMATFFLIWTLDHELLRPELRLAGGAHLHARGVRRLRPRRARDPDGGGGDLLRRRRREWLDQYAAR